MLEAILLSALRVTAFMLFFPVFRQLRVPLSLRVAMTAVVCLMLWPNFLVTAFSLQTSDWQAAGDAILLYGMFEVALGLLLALSSGAVFFAVEWLAMFLLALLKSERWDAQDSLLAGGPGNDPMHLRLPLCVLTASLVLNSQTFDRLLAPLAESFLQQPVRSVPEVLSLAESLVPSIFTFSLFLALPFFAVSLLVELLYLVLRRLCAPYLPADSLESLRIVVVVLALSLGIGFIESASIQFGQYQQ